MAFFCRSDLIANQPNEIECYELMLKPKNIVDALNDAKLIIVSDSEINAVDDSSDSSDSQ